MNARTTFNWQQLGKADYAQAHALVASLPEGNRQCLKGISHELLCRLIHLSWLFSEKSGRGTGYCWPTLKTLARYTGRSTRTVERHLSKLRAAGLISYRKRMTRVGAWTSNLYQLGKVFLASLMARRSKKPQQIRVATQMSHNDLKKGIEAAPTAGEPASDSAFLRKLREHRPHMPSGHVVSFAKPVVEEEMSTVDRKAMLKQQAEALKARGL